MNIHLNTKMLEYKDCYIHLCNICDT